MTDRSRSLARRILGTRYGALSEAASNARLSALELRVSDLERRVRLDVTSQLAGLLYQSSVGRPPTTIDQHELRVFSQNGEDGIILRLLAATGCPNQRLAEIGIGDGSECNSANLIVNWGWSGVLVEADAAGARAAAALHHGRSGVRVKQAFVTAETVNELLPAEPIDLLSIDIDGNDYWVWRAVEATPRVVVIEYNASLGPDRSVTVPYEPGFDYTVASEHRLYHGASLAALARLGDEKGMALVGCDSQGVNAFFVQREFVSDLLPEQPPSQAWRPIQKRLRRWSQHEQERLLEGFTFVDV